MINHRKLTYILFVAILSLTIIGYNYWSYKCGYCTLASLLSFSAPAIILIGCNLLAAAVLVVVRLRKKRQDRLGQCDCGENLRNIWLFCPTCGDARKA